MEEETMTVSDIINKIKTMTATDVINKTKTITTTDIRNKTKTIMRSKKSKCVLLSTATVVSLVLAYLAFNEVKQAKGSK